MVIGKTDDQQQNYAEGGHVATVPPTITRERPEIVDEKLITERAALDAELTAWRAENDLLKARWDVLHKRDDDLIARWTAALDDAEVLADAALREELCRRAYYHGDAAERQRRLIDGAYVRVHGVDARDETTGDRYYLPAPQISLTRDVDTAAVAAEIENWFTVWALGRTSLAIDVMERSLSEFGSYRIAYAPGAEVALIVTRWSRPETLIAGTLVEVLDYVAKHHPAPSYGDASNDDEDD